MEDSKPHFHMQDLSFRDIPTPSKQLISPSVSEDTVQHLERLADIVGQNLSKKRDHEVGIIYVAKAYCEDSEKKKLFKLGYATKKRDDRVKSISSRCKQPVEFAFESPIPFKGVRRAEQIIITYFHAKIRTGVRCLCGTKHTEWVYITDDNDLDLVRLLVFSLWIWMDKTPYDFSTRQLRPVWKKALSEWQDTIETSRPGSFVDFLLRFPDVSDSKLMNHHGILFQAQHGQPRPGPVHTQSVPRLPRDRGSSGTTLSTNTPSKRRLFSSSNLEIDRLGLDKQERDDSCEDLKPRRHSHVEILNTTASTESSGGLCTGDISEAEAHSPGHAADAQHRRYDLRHESNRNRSKFDASSNLLEIFGTALTEIKASLDRLSVTRDENNDNPRRTESFRSSPVAGHDLSFPNDPWDMTPSKKITKAKSSGQLSNPDLNKTSRNFELLDVLEPLDNPTSISCVNVENKAVNDVQASVQSSAGLDPIPTIKIDTSNHLKAEKALSRQPDALEQWTDEGKSHSPSRSASVQDAMAEKMSPKGLLTSSEALSELETLVQTVFLEENNAQACAGDEEACETLLKEDHLSRVTRTCVLDNHPHSARVNPTVKRDIKIQSDLLRDVQVKLIADQSNISNSFFISANPQQDTSQAFSIQQSIESSSRPSQSVAPISKGGFGETVKPLTDKNGHSHVEEPASSIFSSLSKIKASNPKSSVLSIRPEYQENMAPLFFYPSGKASVSNLVETHTTGNINQHLRNLSESRTSANGAHSPMFIGSEAKVSHKAVDTNFTFTAPFDEAVTSSAADLHARKTSQPSKGDEQHMNDKGTFNILESSHIFQFRQHAPSKAKATNASHHEVTNSEIDELVSDSVAAEKLTKSTSTLIEESQQMQSATSSFLQFHANLDSFQRFQDAPRTQAKTKVEYPATIEDSLTPPRDDSKQEMWFTQPPMKAKPLKYSDRIPSKSLAISDAPADHILSSNPDVSSTPKQTQASVSQTATNCGQNLLTPTTSFDPTKWYSFPSDMFEFKPTAKDASQSSSVSKDRGDAFSEAEASTSFTPQRDEKEGVSMALKEQVGKEEAHPVTRKVAYKGKSITIRFPPGYQE